ncbi:MAG: hypothetical protein GY851_33015 [bacterium]|nr:hypothetical protein [bacterium]
MNGLAVSDYIIVGGFFVMMLAIGFYFAGKMKNLKDFFGGGSQVPWWVSGVSLYMSTFSAFAFVAYSGTAYNNGFVAIMVWWTGVPLWIISARFLAARWRRAASTSPLEFVERRYGGSLRQSFAWTGVPLIIIDDALKLLVIGTMVTVSLGTEHESALLIAIAVCGTIMLAYTFLGGLWAVMVTDFIQFIVMITAVIVLIPLVLARVGGFGTFLSEAPEGFWKPTSTNFTWFWLLSFMPIQFLSASTRWSLVQRYYAVKTDADARKVGYLVAFLTFVGVPFLFFPALAARIFMPGIESGNDVYPLICKELLPVGMIGMMVAAMFSATMSMLSSDYNAVASVMTNDIYKRLVNPKASDRTLVLVGRLSTLLIGFIALGVGLALAATPGEKDLVKIMARVFGVLLPPVGIPLLMGLLSRRTSNIGAICGFLTGVVLGLAAYGISYVKPEWEFIRAVTCLTWVTSIPTLVVTTVVSRLAPDSREKRTEVDTFLGGLHGAVPDAQTPEAEDTGGDKAASALTIIGVAGIAMGLLLVVPVTLTESLADAKPSIIVGAIMALAGVASALAGNRMAKRAAERA